MIQKSPRRIREGLKEARNRVELFIGVLGENEAERWWGLGEECAKAAESLRRLLRENEVPQDYKVAVIGRFKAGKSSFVNEVLGRRLAGEDTSPETAAITTFRAGERVIAKIKLVDKDTRGSLKALYGKDPTDPDAHRVANWFKFCAKEQRSAGAAQAETFDLDAIEREHLHPGGHTRLPSRCRRDPARRWSGKRQRNSDVGSSKIHQGRSPTTAW
jgi:Dynamin family